MLRSCIIAFSTYSKIPMPSVEWNEKSMRYSLCFFPAVGAVIGLCLIGLFYGLEYLGIGRIATAACLCALPFGISGGIHMDGFLDTVDAKSSYRSKEERLAILKDPHTGAFAVIFGILYLMLYVGFLTEITGRELPFLALCYVYTRILSGLSVVLFRKAKEDGMAAMSANASHKNVKWILCLELVLCCGAYLWVDPLLGGFCILAGGICMLYYRWMAYRVFGGITGDLAGYFLQISELVILIGTVVIGRMV